MRNAIARIAAALFVLSAAGCSGGGPSGSSGSTPQPSRGSPTLEVLPATFDFGRVTTNNTPAPLEVTIRNTGTASLSVASIGFGSASSPAFTLSFTGGTRPCGSGAPTVAAGESCTFRVVFQPSGNGAFTSNVQIASNAGSPVGLPVTGVSEALAALAVQINQVNTSCPNSNAATAFVSVVDQGGYPVPGLGANSFTLTEGSPPSPNLLLGATRVETDYSPAAITAVLDNSGSVTNQPVMYADMKNGFAVMFNNLRANDVGELINFASEYEVMVAFPSPSSVTNPTNKAALVAGLSVPWTKGSSTLLYDTVYKAIDDTAAQTGYRRAVIVATDGFDAAPGDVAASKRTRAEVISYAVSKKVPVFTIGIGSLVDESALRDIAAQSGGLYYAANASQNLATIYQQLASLIFQNQYVLTFNQVSLGAPGTVAPLNVNTVNAGGITGNASGTIASCN